MTLEQFVNDYNMHDSLIDSLSVEDNGTTIRMIIDFAFWMQNHYQEGDPETGLLEVCFLNVSKYDHPENLPLEEISILKTSLKGNAIVFSLLNDVTDEYLEIEIVADQITVK